MFDSHCHLQMRAFDKDLPAVLERARGVGLDGIVVVGMDIPTSELAVELAARHEGVYAAVGVHPHDAKLVDSQVLDALRELARRPRVVALGETGLDFYRNLSPREVQVKAFQEQLALASELDLPVIIHARDSMTETFAILRDWATAPRADGRPLGVLHCFAGDLATARQCIELGFLISMAGNVTYPAAKRIQQVAAGLPLQHLLTETDCPFLPPQSHRGERCEPYHVHETVDYIAALRNVRPDEVAEKTAANARRLYRLD
ncbi:MAG: TatD family hydrolase [Dehalococcoidia bacterium]|jgi:TatD DNase family protein